MPLGIIETTELERARMVAGGMQQLTPQDFLSYLQKLGYKLEKEKCFNYANRGNEIHYRARSLYIVEIDSGLSFAHVDARRDENFTKLQELRLSSFVFTADRIWEL